MYLSDPIDRMQSARQRRQFPRFQVQCRARIRIGTRQYAGYIHNISQGGARLRTISPIGKLGKVILRLPDLPPLRCRLRWTDSYNAGVAFELKLSREEFLRWAKERSSFESNDMLEAEITAEPTVVA
jgi:PilZ domain-containing protein